MSAPERIWAEKDRRTDIWDAGTFCTENDGGEQYIRADLLTAAQAEIAHLTAERDAAMAGRVKVKPLVWEGHEAPTTFGSYFVYDMRNYGLKYRLDLPSGAAGYSVLHCGRDLMFGTIEAAKAAAQADYEARILAALQPDTERAEPVADVVRGVWGRCEAMEDEAYAKLESDKLTDHEIGFWRGQKLAAKSIRRSTELPQPAPAPQAREITVQEAAEVPCDFLALVFDAMAEADRAMRKFPQPNYVISKLAEEAGETVKAAIHYAEGRETRDAVVGEMLQTIAMMLRLWIEGDEVHGMPALRSIAAMQKGG